MRRARWKRKNVLRKTGARRRLFCLHTGVPTRDIGHLGLDPALGAGQALLNLSVVSPRPGIAKPGCKTDLTCFSFRCRCRSLSPGGESKGEGPQPLPFESFGGVWGRAETPPRFWRGCKGEGSLRQRPLPLPPSPAGPPGHQGSSLQRGILIHRGPPRPRDSSALGMVWMRIPASSSARLVT